MVIQDLINEVGRRLGFQVENGRYQGVRNDIGFDGIWSADGESLVVEVKTTDAYTIKLDVIARYRDRLVESQRIPRDTPILLVIGRNDTESREAQVRWCSKPFGVLLGVATDWTYRWRLGQFFTLGHWLADGWVLGRF